MKMTIGDSGKDDVILTFNGSKGNLVTHVINALKCRTNDIRISTIMEMTEDYEIDDSIDCIETWGENFKEERIIINGDICTGYDNSVIIIHANFADPLHSDITKARGCLANFRNIFCMKYNHGNLHCLNCPFSRQSSRATYVCDINEFLKKSNKRILEIISEQQNV